MNKIQAILLFMNKFSTKTEEPLTVISYEEIKQINVEKDIKYIIKIKPYEEGYCYVIVFNQNYCDVTCDNTRLVSAGIMTLLAGEHSEYHELLKSKTIIPSFNL